jgi:hypothetical protein
MSDSSQPSGGIMPTACPLPLRYTLPYTYIREAVVLPWCARTAATTLPQSTHACTAAHPVQLNKYCVKCVPATGTSHSGLYAYCGSYLLQLTCGLAEGEGPLSQLTAGSQQVWARLLAVQQQPWHPWTCGPVTRSRMGSLRTAHHCCCSSCMCACVHACHKTCMQMYKPSTSRRRCSCAPHAAAHT